MLLFRFALAMVVYNDAETLEPTDRLGVCTEHAGALELNNKSTFSLIA